jgi:hypothetical protein
VKIREEVERFRRAAIEKGDFAEPASRDHALHDEMAQAWQALESIGPEGRAALRALLTDDSPHVRGWVAAQLLAHGDDGVVPILEAEVASGGLLGLESETVLREWRLGRLMPPFGTVDA